MRSSRLGMPAWLAALALAATPAAASATQYAHPSGKTIGACTESWDPCSLPRALAAAAVGEEVIALRGAAPYRMDPFSVVGRTLRGEAGERPVIEGASPGYFLSVASSGATAGRLSHLEVRTVDGTIPVLASGNTVVEDAVARSTGTAVSLNGDARLRDSVAVSSNGIAVRVGPTLADAPARLDSVTAIATGPGSRGLQVGGMAYLHPTTYGCTSLDGHVRARNLLVRGAQYDIEAIEQESDGCDAVATAAISHSNFRTRNTTNGATISEGAGNQTSPAQTDDAAIFADGDLYRQKAGAPTINAGSGEELALADIDGNPRVQGGAVDIGADEFPDPPAATTLPADEVTSTSARLRASVTPGPHPVKVVFDYGTAGLGAATPEVVLTAGGASVPVSASVSGLTPGTAHQYRVRVVPIAAQSTTVHGATLQLTTLSAAAPPVTPGPLSDVVVPRSIRRSAFLRRGLKVRFRINSLGSAYDVRLRAPMRLRGVRATVQLARARRSDIAGTQTVTLRPKRNLKKLLGRARSLKMSVVIEVKSPGHPVARHTATVRMRR